MRFIDLFAGLGGFHLALKDEHQCVFASEIDPYLRRLYKENFGLSPAGDILDVALNDIPPHELLCAGFPCQPFSKAGEQNGLHDPRGGNLISRILNIIRHHQPRFLLLENVPNFIKHDGKRTWQFFKDSVENLGYSVQEQKLSPHKFGVPQIRERVFIVGDREGLAGFRWPDEQGGETSIHSILDIHPYDARPVPPQVASSISLWQDFLDRFPKGEDLPSFPIWGMEFGASYPYSDCTPHSVELSSLQQTAGANGVSLQGLSREEITPLLPSHARRPDERFPIWKEQFIRQNRSLYERHRGWLDEWKSGLLEFPSSFQKFEWNAKGEERNLRSLVLQVRASGLRAKRTNTAPSLVAMTSTQVPIITWEDRYMTPQECARLQSMEGITLPSTPTRAYTALGNAVNVKLAAIVADALLGDHRRACDPHIPMQGTLRLFDDPSPHDPSSVSQAAEPLSASEAKQRTSPSD